MAHGCLQGVKYLMFAFNLLFWGSQLGCPDMWIQEGAGGLPGEERPRCQLTPRPPPALLWQPDPHGAGTAPLGTQLPSCRRAQVLGSLGPGSLSEVCLLVSRAMCGGGGCPGGEERGLSSPWGALPPPLHLWVGAQGSPRGSFCGPRGGLVGLGVVLGRGRAGSERGRCFWAPLAGGPHPDLSRVVQPAPAQLRARLPASLAGAPPGLVSGRLPAPPPPAVWAGSVCVAGLGVEPCLPPRLPGKSCPPGVLSFPSSTTGGPWFSPSMSYRQRPGLLSLASGRDALRPVEDAGKGLCSAGEETGTCRAPCRRARRRAGACTPQTPWLLLAPAFWRCWGRLCVLAPVSSCNRVGQGSGGPAAWGP
ncbi:tetraspanin-4 isoform X1 [Kogia breviceps]|uniref:tetraspanin-4 isoform X1 n=1 Tax=Kogia breviceps TaxID=27615 RepID=UPI0034D1B0EF